MRLLERLARLFRRRPRPAPRPYWRDANGLGLLVHDYTREELEAEARERLARGIEGSSRRGWLARRRPRVVCDVVFSWRSRA